MRRFVVSVHDRALLAFGQPWFVPALGAAVRAFSDEVNNPQGAMKGHADDYELFHLGYFDEDSGVFENLDNPERIAIGKNVLLPKDTI